jgi:L-cysteine/cystine lyase
VSDTGPPNHAGLRAYGVRHRQNPRVTFEEARASFPVLERFVYLQAGSVGPLARPTMDAMRAEQERGLAEGRGSRAQFERILALREELRADVAALVGVTPEQVALTASTTDGCNIVLAGLGLEARDEVITTTDEHFGLIGPLHVSGCTVVVVEPNADSILAAVTPRTRLVAVSHVLWTTGAVLPVHELRARSGIPILVDGAQSVGAMPVDATGLDFYTISGQKWLCGPEGTGALVVAEPEQLRVARPSYLSQRSYERDGSFEPQPGAARFDPNVTPNPLTAGLRAAIAACPAWAYERAAHTADRLRDLLRDVGEDVVVPDERGTLLSWRAPVDETELIVARLADASVIVRDLPGRGLVRASIGWWTSEDDLERLVSAL